MHKTVTNMGIGWSWRGRCARTAVDGGMSVARVQMSQRKGQYCTSNEGGEGVVRGQERVGEQDPTSPRHGVDIPGQQLLVDDHLGAVHGVPAVEHRLQRRVKHIRVEICGQIIHEAMREREGNRSWQPGVAGAEGRSEAQRVADGG